MVKVVNKATRRGLISGEMRSTMRTPRGCAKALVITAIYSGIEGKLGDVARGRPRALRDYEDHPAVQYVY